MAFRADEVQSRGEERAHTYLVSRTIEPGQRAESERAFADILDEMGPVIDSYPTWHPLVAAHTNKGSPSTTPDRECGYKGLDHTVFFANGFVTCPYGDGQEVIDAVHALPYERPSPPVATISAERLDAQFYHPGTTAVLVRCQWEHPLPTDGMIPEVVGRAPDARAGAAVLAMGGSGGSVGDDAALLPGTAAWTSVLALREPGNRSGDEEPVERAHQHRDVRLDQSRLCGIPVKARTAVRGRTRSTHREGPLGTFSGIRKDFAGHRPGPSQRPHAGAPFRAAHARAAPIDPLPHPMRT